MEQNIGLLKTHGDLDGEIKVTFILKIFSYHLLYYLIRYKGYMNISRNIVNNCGIASYVYIPVL